MPILFHLDENVDHGVVDGLRRRGIDVTTASDARLIGASDPDHVEFALQEGRVIFTHDSDFLRIANEGVSHAGIAYCHPRDHSIGEIILALVVLWRSREPEEVRNRVVFL